jgi:uncharacterized protein (DUF1501 family)
MMNNSRSLLTARRQFLGASVTSAIGLALCPSLQKAFADGPVKRRAKSCILIWLNGGPSHIDTFDPKPGADTNGPFTAIETRVAGMQFSQHLPRLAEQAQHLAVVRSMTSNEGDHDRANYLLHTGNQRTEALAYPGLGSVVAREWQAEDGDLPAYVALNGTAPSAGFFGVEFSPHIIGNLDAPLENVTLPEGMTEERLEKRLKALDSFNDGSLNRVDRERLSAQKATTAKAARFRKSSALKAFDLSDESPETLTTYGATQPEGSPIPGTFGRACIMARRLIESGVRFVEVTLDGWDTHANNFELVAALLNQLDPAFAALTSDLSNRGLLDETLVICMGEFGRTPQINVQMGRDHWSDAFSVVLTGGGIRGGQVIGTTDAKGEKVADRPVSVPDLFTTLLATFGVEGHKVYRTPSGRPIKLADKGTVVAELLT